MLPASHRSEVDELRCKYDLEPTLRDIFVEGASDRHFLELFLPDLTTSSYAVREISDVSIPKEELAAKSLCQGNRSRLIFLAEALEPDSGMCATIVIDRDYDDIYLQYPAAAKLPNIVRTDFASIELYAYSVRPLNRLIKTMLRGFPVDASTVLDNLEPTLRKAYLFRISAMQISRGLSWVPIERCCTVLDNQELVLDEEEFIKRWLGGNAAPPSRAKLVEQMQLLKHDGDRRCAIRGHDFSTLLYWYIGKVAKKKQTAIVSVDILQRSLLTCVEFADIKDMDMFQRIKSRLESN